MPLRLLPRLVFAVCAEAALSRVIFVKINCLAWKTCQKIKNDGSVVSFVYLSIDHTLPSSFFCFFLGIMGLLTSCWKGPSTWHRPHPTPVGWFDFLVLVWFLSWMSCFVRPSTQPPPAQELPRNTYEGYLCFMGHDSHFADMANMAATG